MAWYWWLLIAVLTLSALRDLWPVLKMEELPLSWPNPLSWPGIAVLGSFAIVVMVGVGIILLCHEWFVDHVQDVAGPYRQVR